MLLVDDVLLFPTRGLCWIFREIHHAAQEELAHERESITLALKELYTQLEAKKISEAEFDAREKTLLDRLDELEAQDMETDSA